jgi:hypothetical protein
MTSTVEIINSGGGYRLCQPWVVAAGGLATAGAAQHGARKGAAAASAAGNKGGFVWGQRNGTTS